MPNEECMNFKRMHFMNLLCLFSVLMAAVVYGFSPWLNNLLCLKKQENIMACFPIFIFYLFNWVNVLSDVVDRSYYHGGGKNYMMKSFHKIIHFKYSIVL